MAHALGGIQQADRVIAYFSWDVRVQVEHQLTARSMGGPPIGEPPTMCRVDSMRSMAPLLAGEHRGGLLLEVEVLVVPDVDLDLVDRATVETRR